VDDPKHGAVHLNCLRKHQLPRCRLCSKSIDRDVQVTQIGPVHPKCLYQQQQRCLQQLQ
jgi:hypothetical protein